MSFLRLLHSSSPPVASYRSMTSNNLLCATWTNNAGHNAEEQDDDSPSKWVEDAKPGTAKPAIRIYSAESLSPRPFADIALAAAAVVRVVAVGGRVIIIVMATRVVKWFFVIFTKYSGSLEMVSRSSQHNIIPNDIAEFVRLIPVSVASHPHSPTTTRSLSFIWHSPRVQLLSHCIPSEAAAVVT